MYECNCADPSCCCDKIREVMAENEVLRKALLHEFQCAQGLALDEDAAKAEIASRLEEINAP